MPKSKVRKKKPHHQGKAVAELHSKHPDSQVTRCGLGAGNLAMNMSDISCRKCFIRTAMELEGMTNKDATRLWNETKRILEERRRHVTV